MTDPSRDGETPPADPMTMLKEGAVAAHEVFVSFVEAGFTEKQAEYLTGVILVAQIK